MKKVILFKRAMLAIGLLICVFSRMYAMTVTDFNAKYSQIESALEAEINLLKKHEKAVEDFLPMASATTKDLPKDVADAANYILTHHEGLSQADIIKVVRPMVEDMEADIAEAKKKIGSLIKGNTKYNLAGINGDMDDLETKRDAIFTALPEVK